MNLIWKSKPLHAILGSFCPSRQSGGANPSVVTFWNDVAHTASKAYRIGTHHTLVLAVVGKRHHAVVMFSLVKFKRSEIHPCATTHLLVHLELCLSSLMINRIGGIIHRLLVGGVGHIYGILSLFRNVGNPLCNAFIFG